MTNDPSSPFFLVGAVRSGTTVLRLLLGHHPMICRCDEFEFVASAIADREAWPDISAYVDGLAGRRDFRASGYRPNSKLSFPELARDLLAQRQAVDDKPILGATVHNHFDELPRIWPEARFIYLDRDPRDVSRSCVQMGWAGNAWSGAEIWIRAHDAWQRLCQKVPTERRLEIKFEELTADTEAVLARITRFLGVDYVPAMLEIEKDTTYRRPDPRASRSWRDDASETEVREMEARLSGRLEKAGYLPSGLPALQITPLRRLVLRWTSRIGRMRFGQRRYGLALWMRSWVTRRLLPIRAWRDRTQLAIDRINETHLK